MKQNPIRDFFNSQYMLGLAVRDLAVPLLSTNYYVFLLQRVFTRYLVMMLNFMVCSQRQ